jgi:hypothetical protein
MAFEEHLSPCPWINFLAWNGVSMTIITGAQAAEETKKKAEFPRSESSNQMDRVKPTLN